MVRSKFPGKPSKHVNKKRINVLPPVSETIIECSNSMTVETVAENKQVQDETNNDNNDENVTSSNSPVNTKVSLRRRLNRKMQNTKSLISNNPTKMGLMSKICNKTSVKTVKNKLNCKGTRKSNVNRKSVHSYSTIKSYKQCRNVPKENNNIVGKFVLPTRSVHSSRVIKPNKRFLNVDLSDPTTLTLRKKVINKRHNLKQPQTDNVSTEPEINKSSSSSSSIINNSENNTATLTNNSDVLIPSESPTKTLTNGRVVLRQARLKLHNQTPKGSEGPFSSNSSTNGSPPGTVTCGVCGAVRFYRFVKQARKFNIYSCESCRKFISKLIKRQTCGKPIVSSTLVCHKGQGMCHVPPIVRSQQMKLIRCAYRSRCPACWLKMCLRSFQMPMSLKNSLVQLLPDNMKGSDVIFNNSLPLLWQSTNVQSIDNRIKSISEQQQLTTASLTEIKQRPVRNVTKPVTQQAAAPPQIVSDVKRQKIDLKGPRVKHVCRSASIVLGQPLATFPHDNNKDANDKKKEKEVEKEKKIETKALSVTFNESLLNENNIKQVQQKDLIKINNNKNVDVNISESESSDSDKLPRFLNDNMVSMKKEKNSQRVPFLSTTTTTSSNLLSDDKFIDTKKNNENTIAIDYCENYDWDDISQNGFCLIASQQFPMPAICFLCGSAGREALLHCTLCCEPYHPFCLEQIPPIRNNNNRQFMWLCPRCTTCNACNQTGRQKVNCQKCSKTYHSECLNNNDENRPLICSKCLTCKGCGRENTTKFIGNIPLCTICLKQRKKGNSCQICFGIYDEMDLSEMMMECTKCNQLIHAKCEGLSDEYYNILSTLPESIKYLCNTCSKNTTPYWRKAVDSELKFNFNQILKLLSKNKKARNVLKFSPLNNKQNKSSTKLATSVRKIQFLNDYDHVADLNEDIYDINSQQNQIENDLCDLGNENNNKMMLIEQKVDNPNKLLEIKTKINSGGYYFVREFNKDMTDALNETNCDELINIYNAIFQSVFPWFKQNQFSNDDDDNDLLNSTLKLQQLSSNVYNCEDDVCDQIECVGIDSRYCSFCKNIGDGFSHLESRLLYCGYNEWVHINCALWSSEVYEEIDGALQNIPSALSRGKQIRCSYCKQKGATVGCCFKGCYETYHFICARTAKCHFFHNQTIYCGNHELPPNAQLLTVPTDFNIRRSVFIELSDNKKCKYSQIDKVNVMVGSLCVTNLGKIHPNLSDHLDTIIPTGYVCSRLFWSTIEPWKLVAYKITTSILNANTNNQFSDKNFTVDHTLPKTVVERKLKEIMTWHKDINKKKMDLYEFVVDDDEEPQNGAAADLLSPEITDAIFEELPHEILDGISVQDIFPKLMSNYEDFISIDCKSETTNSDNSDKKSDELLSDATTQDQRSCSLTLSCKLDNTFSPVIKKRKIAAPSREFFQLLQVDGNFDESSSSECGSPTGLNNENVWDTTSRIICEEPVTCERCQCTYRTQASYKRHLDTCDAMTSESDSELIQEHDQNNVESAEINIMESSTILTQQQQQPVVLAQYESYQNEIHTSVLNTQTFVTSKSTTSELIVPPNELIHSIPAVANLETTNESFVSRSTLSINEQTTTNHQSTQFCLNQNVPLCVNPSLISVNPTFTINQSSLDFQSPQVTLQPLSYSNNITPVINVAPQSQILSNQIITTQELMNGNNRWVKSTKSSPTSATTTATFQQQQVVKSPKTTTTTKRSRSIASKDEPTIILPSQATIVQHLPSATTNFIPTFVDAFQQNQHGGQNVQYVATIAAPQINSTLHSQPLVQLQSDNNLISLMQPTTMIIQQPRVIENQLVLDSNGSLSWAPQAVQPVYYGFETIVQNTVMQSQQFLPSTVPGVLTANSSYSTTTQVFQTSKLEPVLDVAANSFVLLNPSQLVSNGTNNNNNVSSNNNTNGTSHHQPIIDVTQNTQTQPQSINNCLISHNNHVSNSNNNIVVQQQKQQASIVVANPIATTSTAPTTTISNKYSNNSFQNKSNITSTHNHHHHHHQNSNSITLPKAPFVPEQQGIPTNIVTPTPKLQPAAQIQTRPMSRVLPMQSIVVKEPKIKPIINNKQTIIIEKNGEIKKDLNKFKDELITLEKPLLSTIDDSNLLHFEKNLTPIVDKDQIQIEFNLNDDDDHPDLILTNKNSDSLKLLFQKQSQDGTYKISTNSNPNFIDKSSVITTTVLTQNNATAIAASPPLPTTKLQTNYSKPSQENNYKINNNFPNSKNSQVQVAPLKPIKSMPAILPLSEKQNRHDCNLNVKSEKNIESPMKVYNNNNENYNNFKKEIENIPAILYTIETQDGFKYSSTSVTDLWTKVFEAVQHARASHNMPSLPPDSTNIMNSWQILGLKTAGLKYLIEQLPGAGKCTKYKPTYNFPSKFIEIEDEPIGHSCGCARSAPNAKKNEPCDLFGWLASKHREPEILSEFPKRGLANNLPMATRFRQLKSSSKTSVGVYRSKIHRRGLFCLRDFDAGEMVIEYSGEVIRSILTDKREKYYNSKGIGCYMFRIDDNLVVDATMTGNAARFINHSCDPNCYSKVVDILGHKHIIIFALRRIICGEELTYDYKFPIEEDKIPCTCGTKRCRKFLN